MTRTKVKGFTLSLYDSLVPFMLEKAHREVKQMRAKVIAFRDFYCDGKYIIFMLDKDKDKPYFALKVEDAKKLQN